MINDMNISTDIGAIEPMDDTELQALSLASWRTLSAISTLMCHRFAPRVLSITEATPLGMRKMGALR